MELAVAREIMQWIITGVGINATALLAVIASITIFSFQLSRQTQAMWLDLRRRHDNIDDDLREIKNLLREQ